MRSEPEKFVLDTNVLISAALYPQSPAARAVTIAFAFGKVCRSSDTFQELTSVLNRPKFDRYFLDPASNRARFLSLYEKYSTEFPVTEISTDCSDPKDNRFLSLALSAGADVIVSGDQKHLLSMHPYRGIAILSVAEFVLRVSQRQT